MNESIYSNKTIYLQHWDPSHHVRMCLDERAAQFTPFAALVGFEDLLASVEKTHKAAFKEVFVKPHS